MLSLVLAALVFNSTANNDGGVLTVKGKAFVSSFAEVQYEAIPSQGLLFIDLVDKGPNKKLRTFTNFTHLELSGFKTLKDVEHIVEVEGLKLYKRSLQAELRDVKSQLGGK